MRDFNKKVCRLCLVIAPTCECETIEKIKKEILEVLQINIDFAISNYAVACTRCLKILEDCFDFKTHIATLMDIKIKNTSQSEMIGKSLCLEKARVCQLCISLIKEETFNYTTDLKGGVLLKDMIRNCFPEVDLNSLANEPSICIQCVSGLERYYDFIKNCRAVEQRIEHFCRAVNHCTAGRVNLEDMLIFKDYDLLGTPVIIKKECSDAENVDENATKCLKSEEIIDIKCEEIHIKDELDNGAEESGSYQLGDCENSGIGKGSSKRKKVVRKCEPGERNNVCLKCPYSTNNNDHFKKHVLTHSDNEQHCCTLCSFVTDAKLLLQAHMASHRGLTKKYGCSECTYETDRKYILDAHSLKHKDISEVEMHKCLSCPFQSKYKSKLTSHRKLHLEKTTKMYKCQECSFVTKYSWSLITHHLVHEDPKVANKFKCEKCPFRTKWPGGFKKHMACHFLKHTYSCETCTYSSKTSGKMLRHQLMHQVDKDTNECKLPSYRVKRFVSVKTHVKKTHTDSSKLPNFQCAHCPYETAVKAALSSHIRWRHYSKDQRPFKCELCEFCTWAQSHLKLHQSTHTELGEAMWHHCATCDYQTIYKKRLERHVRKCVENEKNKGTKVTDAKKKK